MSCPTGKLTHRNQRAAKAHMKGLGERPGEPLTAYRCRFCHAWHVGRSKIAAGNPKRDAWKAKMLKGGLSWNS